MREAYPAGMNWTWTCGALAAAWILAGCAPAPENPAAAATPAGAAQAPVEVSGERALEEVRAFLEVGPRDAGTPGAERAATYLVERLRALGVAAEIQEFREPSPLGPETVFRNVLGRIPGRTDRIVLLGSHYDTKTGIPDFVGANDSGSSTGLLLELARAFAAAGTPELEIRFAFFDGEECRVEYGPADGFHGSRHLARTMEADGSLSNVAAMILLDMVGDRDLTLTVPRNSTPGLVSLAFAAARAEGVRERFQLYPYNIGDDHVAFFGRGVPAIDLIDFAYGSAPGLNDYWHTPADTLDKLSAESLDLVGRVVARMVAELSALRGK